MLLSLRIPIYRAEAIPVGLLRLEIAGPVPSVFARSAIDRHDEAQGASEVKQTPGMASQVPGHRFCRRP